MKFSKQIIDKHDVWKAKIIVTYLGEALLNHQSAFILFESENERQKIEPVPIPLPDVKTRNIFFFHNWTSEIIPFIRFEMQMDGT